MQRKVIRVRDIMHQRFVRMDGRATVAELVAELRGSDKQAAIVEKRHQDDELGLVLLSDIAKKVMSDNRAPQRVSLYEIMAKPVLSVRPDMDVRYCARMFHRFGLTLAPVIDGDEILGMVGYRELVLDGLWEENES